MSGVLSVSGLSKRFRSGREDVRAVDGVSFDVAVGQLFTLLGPSGCGKTTTLRCVAGLERPDTGEVRLAGRLLSAHGVWVPASDRRIGMVFQSYAIWPHMDVFENAAFPLRVLSRRERPRRRELRERVEGVLAAVKLDHLAGRAATDLSGGQQQRLALARALVMQPPLLLLDEPLSNLDARLREEMRFELKRLQAEVGFTAVYVTHDQIEALAMSDVVAVMRDGRIEQAGTPQEVYERPATTFVADFIGVSNLIEGVVDGRAENGTLLVRTAAGLLRAHTPAELTVGQAVVLGVRAERVRMTGARGRGESWVGAVAPPPPRPSRPEPRLRSSSTRRPRRSSLRTASDAVLDDARRGARYLVGLRRFLREPMTPAEARERVRHGLETREEAFLHVLEQAVYARPASPYRRLLTWAGVELGDAAALVHEHGLDEALGRLYDAGIRVTLDELKGRVPIERPGLAIEPAPDAFDNPLVRSTFSSQTGGSRGPAIRVRMNFGSLERGTVYTALLLSSFDLFGRSTALWRPVPPGRAGLHWALQASKLRQPVDRWFAQTKLGPGKELAYLRAALLGTRLWAAPVPTPEHVPLDRAEVVARWLAGRRAHLNATASSAVRVCLAAEQHGLDVSGTLFRVGGEPLTEAKAEVVARVGAEVICTYTISEIGRVGIACAAAEQRDEQHVATDTLGVVQRDRGTGVGALHYTTLHRDARVLLLNAELGDQGVLTRRACGCPLDEVGLDLHLHGIRSYEKLTSEGMNFYGADLIALVEDVLPSRFGGAPTDYQVVEEEVDGLPRVSVVVSPRVGWVDEREVVAAAAAAFRAGPAHHGMMADVWRDADTLRVVRREPYATSAAKVLPLHIRQPTPSDDLPGRERLRAARPAGGS